MNFPIPDFVPVPSAEIMQTISIISLIIGICLVGVGLLFLFLNKKKGKEKKSSLECLALGLLGRFLSVFILFVFCQS